MDKLEQGSEAGVLAGPEVGDDGLDEGDHEHGEAEQRVQLLGLDGLQTLVDDDGDEAGDAEEDAEDHADPVHLEPDSHAHYLPTLSRKSSTAQQEYHYLLTVKISLQYLAVKVPRLANRSQARTMKLAWSLTSVPLSPDTWEKSPRSTDSPVLPVTLWYCILSSPGLIKLDILHDN